MAMFLNILLLLYALLLKLHLNELNFNIFLLYLLFLINFQFGNFNLHFITKIRIQVFATNLSVKYNNPRIYKNVNCLMGLNVKISLCFSTGLIGFCKKQFIQKAKSKLYKLLTVTIKVLLFFYLTYCTFFKSFSKLNFLLRILSKRFAFVCMCSNLPVHLFGNCWAVWLTDWLNENQWKKQ